MLDYLVEEVLQQQSESIQKFLLRTSILNRLSGSLCDAILLDPSVSGQETLEYLDHANLFIVPLDNQRRWYRYYHLFADLLRHRLYQSSVTLTGNEEVTIAELHMRASQWYDENGLEIEAFHHATNYDIGRAERLIEGRGMPLHFRGEVLPVLNWLKSLSKTVLDARPSLWVMYASALTMTGQTTGVEQILQAAEAALQDFESDDRVRNLIGHIAAIRALLAATQNRVDTIITQSNRALEYLAPNNLPVRTATNWKLGYAYQLQGDRAAARRAYTEAISSSQVSRNIIINILATIGLGNIQEAENQLNLAAQTYKKALQLATDLTLPISNEAHCGLARIFYQWNDLDASRKHVQQSLLQARKLESTDRFIACKVFLARLKIVQGDMDSASVILAEADQIARQHNFVHQMSEIADVQVLLLLHQGKVAKAAQLTQTHELPISQARVYLAQGDTTAAMAVLEPLQRQAEQKKWQNKRLKVMVIQAVAFHEHGEKDKAVQLLGDALVLAAPSGFIRIFIDEGILMARLLFDAAARGMMPNYIDKLLTAFEGEQKRKEKFALPDQTLIEPLSQRELEVLKLIAQGLSNQEISERLFLALSTVKGHNRIIFGKLQVQRRTEAVARARQLGLL